MQQQIRILRVLEYSGDREAVEQMLRRSMNEEKTFEQYNPETRKFLGKITIKAATLGIVPELLEKGEENGNV
jgi:hypothetical protein